MRRSRPAKPKIITDALLRSWPLPHAREAGSKEARGRVLIVAGAIEMPGGAILASTAALRAGAGKVRVAIAADAALFVAAAVPELFVLPIPADRERKATLRALLNSAQNADAVLIGPGMRDEDLIRALLPEFLRFEELRALVIDATALAVAAELLPEQHAMRGKVVMTPHAGEMAMLANVKQEELETDRLGVASDVARRSGSVVALKGAETLVCSPDGATYLNRRGNAGLATAGSGDVLAGVIAGLCARGLDPVQATVWGVAMHARAGEALARRIGGIGYLARELPQEIPRLAHAIVPS